MNLRTFENLLTGIGPLLLCVLVTASLSARSFAGECPTCVGDLDGSGTVDSADVAIFTDSLLDLSNHSCSDITGDGNTNGLDIQGMSTLTIGDDGMGSECGEITEACCLGNESCQDLGVGQCLSAGGVPQGNGSSCGLNGAGCCNDFDPCTVDSFVVETGECLHTTVECDDDNLCTFDQCNPGNGECNFTPIICLDPNPCTTDDCDPQSGCVFTPVECDDNNQCTVDKCNEEDGECIFFPKVCFDGDDCTTDTCNIQNGECEFTLSDGCGACCNANGGCEDNTANDECTSPSTFFEGSMCSDLDCQALTGACCNADGNCTDNTTNSECPAPGTFMPGQQCADVLLCQVFTGACCVDNSECFDGVLQSECPAPSEFFLGDGCTAIDCLPRGACCDVNRNCTDDVTSIECVAPNTFIEGEQCEIFYCEEIPGACCEVDGGCSEGGVESECDGDFFPNQACAETVCEALTGACCTDPCTCIETTSDQCNGVFNVGSSCVEATCLMGNTVCWNTDAGGLWNDGNNWSTGTPPGPGQIGYIDRPGVDITVTHQSGTSMPDAIQSTEAIHVTGGTLNPTTGDSNIHELNIDGGVFQFDGDGDLTVDHLTMTSGTLSGVGDINVQLTFDMLSGTLTDVGTTRIGDQASATFRSTGFKSITGGRTFENGGNASFQDMGALFITSGAVFNNLAGATFDIQNDEPLDFSFGQFSSFNNSGTVRKSSGSGTSTIDFGISFNNDGTVDIQTGTLNVTGGGQSGGIWNIDTDAGVEFNSSDYEFNVGTNISGDGVARQTGGTLTVNDATVENFELIAGTLNGDGTLGVTNNFNWTGGSQRGDGITNVSIDGFLTMSGPADKTLADGRTINNGGNAFLNGNGDLIINNGAVFNNLAGATFEVQSDADLDFFSGSFSSFNNDGGFTKSGGAGTTLVDFGLMFNNDGTVSIQSGTLRFDGGGVNRNSITANENTGVEFRSGNTPFTLDIGSDLNGSGQYSVGSGNFNINAGADTSMMNFEIAGGNVTNDANLFVDNLTQSGGVLGGIGTTNVTQQFDWSGGTHSDAGITNIASNANTMISGSLDKTLRIDRTFNNGGDAVMSDDGSLFINSGAVFNNLSGATFDVQTDASFEFFSGTFTAFNNNGTFTKSGGVGTSQFEPGLSFNNDGTVNIQTGTLRLSGGGTGGGIWNLNQNAGVNFDSNSYAWIDNTIIAGDGTASVTFGTVTVSGNNVNVDNFDQVQGNVDGDGILTVNNQMNWINGTQTGNGMTSLPFGSTLNLTGVGNKSLRGGRTFNHAGDAIYSGDSSLFIDSGAVFNNLAGATFDVQDDASFEFFTGTPSAFNNGGSFTKSGGNDTTLFEFGLAFNNDGTVSVQTGTLQFNGGGIHTGSVNVEENATIAFASSNLPVVLSTPFSNTGEGDWRVTGGTLDVESGVSVNANVFSVAGILNADGNVSADTLELVNGSIEGVGDVSGMNTSFLGGSMQDGGTTTVPIGGFFNIGGSANKTMNGRMVNNHGQTTLSGTGDFFITNGAVFNNLAGATFDVQSDADFRFSSGDASQFLNDGLFTKSGGDDVSLFNANIMFNNDGTVQVQTGTLAFNSPYTQTSGNTSLFGGNIDVGTFDLQILGGGLNGNGTIFGTGIIGGTGMPGLSPGSLEFTGDYEQTADGQLNIEIGGLTPVSEHDVLIVGGEATLAGTLNISLINEYSPSVGDTFVIMTFTSRVGDFKTYVGLDIGDGLVLVPSFNATSLLLTVEHP